MDYNNNTLQNEYNLRRIDNREQGEREINKLNKNKFANIVW